MIEFDVKTYLHDELGHTYDVEGKHHVYSQVFLPIAQVC